MDGRMSHSRQLSWDLVSVLNFTMPFMTISSHRDTRPTYCKTAAVWAYSLQQFENCSRFKYSANKLDLINYVVLWRMEKYNFYFMLNTLLVHGILNCILLRVFLFVCLFVAVVGLEAWSNYEHLYAHACH